VVQEPDEFVEIPKVQHGDSKAPADVLSSFIKWSERSTFASKCCVSVDLAERSEDGSETDVDKFGWFSNMVVGLAGKYVT